MFTLTVRTALIWLGVCFFPPTPLTVSLSIEISFEMVTSDENWGTIKANKCRGGSV